MMPEAMKCLLRESLPAPTWERNLSEEGARRYLELRRDDGPALRALGLNPDDLGPSLVACMWDEDGDLEVGGFLVVDNLEVGTPSMGGIRLGPDIVPKVIHDLARGMTLKNAAAGLPYGGGKSGIVVSRDLARVEHDDVVRGFARLLTRYRDIYNPGPDVGTDDADMRTVATENGLDAAVSKPQEMGGVGIDEFGCAAGGVVIALETALEELPKLRRLPQFRDLQVPASGETTVLIQGFGAVGANAAMIMQGWPEGRRPRVVGISDADGCLTCNAGLPVPELFEHWRSGRGAVLPYALEHGLGKGPLDAGTYSSSADDLLRESAFALIPASPVFDYLGLDDEGKHSCTVDRMGGWRVIVEGANTYSPAPEVRFRRATMETAVYAQRGVLILQDYLVNTGGVIFAAQERLVPTPRELRIPEDRLGNADAVAEWLGGNAVAFRDLSARRAEAGEKWRREAISRNVREVVDLLASEPGLLPSAAAERLSLARLRAGQSTASVA